MDTTILIQEEISKNWAHVYRAKKNDEDICIKFFKHKRKNKVCTSMITELGVLANTCNKYIISKLFIFEIDSSIGFALQWISLSFRDCVREGIKFNIPRVIKQMQIGLAHLHYRGFIHRDIKPDNIMIDFDSKRIKIIDFGLAYFIGNVGATGDELIPHLYDVQTEGYRAPEITQQLPYSCKIDIYGLGMVFIKYIIFKYQLSDIKIDDYYRWCIDNPNELIPEHLIKMIHPNSQLRPYWDKKILNIITPTISISINRPANYLDVAWIIEFTYEYGLSKRSCIGAITLYCKYAHIFSDPFELAYISLYVMNGLYDEYKIDVKDIAELVESDVEKFTDLVKTFLSRIDFAINIINPLHYKTNIMQLSSKWFALLCYEMMTMELPNNPDIIARKCDSYMNNYRLKLSYKYYDTYIYQHLKKIYRVRT